MWLAWGAHTGEQCQLLLGVDWGGMMPSDVCHSTTYTGHTQADWKTTGIPTILRATPHNQTITVTESGWLRQPENDTARHDPTNTAWPRYCTKRLIATSRDRHCTARTDQYRLKQVIHIQTYRTQTSWATAFWTPPRRHTASQNSLTETSSLHSTTRLAVDFILLQADPKISCNPSQPQAGNDSLTDRTP